MGRSVACLWVLLAVGAPAFAASRQPAETRAGLTIQGADAAGLLRIASAFGAITSTYRSAAHNRAVGGVPNSHHLRGRAIDIARRPGVTHHQIAAAFRRAGYHLIESLDEGDHSHFAFGPSAAVPFERAPAVTAARLRPDSIMRRPLADQHGTLYLDLAQSGASRAK